MTRIVDLSQAIANGQGDVNEVEIKLMTAKQGAQHMATEMRDHFGIEVPDNLFPNGEFLTNEYVSLTTHTGTHVDAPAHYGSPPDGQSAMTIDQLPLSWFFGNGVMLHFTDRSTGTISAHDIAEQLQQIDYELGAGDIVLLHTGADKNVGTQKYFTDFVGLDLTAIEMLYDSGIRVVGTDAFSLDAPFAYILNEYTKRKDQSLLWPAHFYGRTNPYCQIERLGNLQDLDRATGFTVACFPTCISHAGAAWTRAVAIIEQ